VTLIAVEDLAAIAAFLGLAAVAPELLRRNMVTRGINLLAFKDRRFRIGTALLQTSGECAPCSRMEETARAGRLQRRPGPRRHHREGDRDWNGVYRRRHRARRLRSGFPPRQCVEKCGELCPPNCPERSFVPELVLTKFGGGETRPLVEQRRRGPSADSAEFTKGMKNSVWDR